MVKRPKAAMSVGMQRKQKQVCLKKFMSCFDYIDMYILVPGLVSRLMTCPNTCLSDAGRANHCIAIIFQFFEHNSRRVFRLPFFTASTYTYRWQSIVSHMRERGCKYIHTSQLSFMGHIIKFAIRSILNQIDGISVRVSPFYMTRLNRAKYSQILIKSSLWQCTEARTLSGFECIGSCVSCRKVSTTMKESIILYRQKGDCPHKSMMPYFKPYFDTGGLIITPE